MTIAAACKRALDILVALSLGLVLAPVLAAVTLLVAASSPGPVLFRQGRLGRNGRPFAIAKFRTMYADSPDLRNPDGSATSSDADPRVTPVGRWLRKTSLDELPQLWNVLRGDMSIVGPRPDQVDQERYYKPQERIKLAVRPGVTGLAQISGRNSISWEQRKKLDVDYVRNWSLGLDLAILMRTIPYVLLGRGVNEKECHVNRNH